MRKTATTADQKKTVNIYGPIRKQGLLVSEIYKGGPKATEN